MKISPFWGILTGLVALVVGIIAYEVFDSWILFGLVFLMVAGIGLCLIDAISEKLTKIYKELTSEEHKGGESSSIDF